MKKLFSALILCTAILCGCSAKGGEEISETDVSETASVTVAAESTAVTSAKMETTTTTEETTVTETHKTFKKQIKIVLTPIPSDEPLEVMACKITDDIMNDKEEDFPDKEALKLARETCFADKEIRGKIDENNINAEDFYLPEEVEAYRIKSAEDMMFISGCTFDFDSDGEDESLICLGYTQTEMGGILGGNALIYIDGREYKILEKGICRGTPAQVISAGEYVFLLSYIGAGASYYCYDIYSFESGMPEKVTVCDGAKSINYENGVFFCEIKFMGTFPFVLCEGGKFRQLGREKISREDFEAHVKNGVEYLGSLAENGDEVTDIYTYGYYNYKLYGEGFCYDIHYYNGFITERYGSDGVGEEFRFTDEVVYGGDVWAATTRSQNYNIGGGYACYISHNDKILNVVKDNIITDSMKLGASNFLPDWQINFYDMETPPCFALSVHGIDYSTYFVIDGKITEMNWTLDGKRLDTVDYTMLKCRGEGDGFVSYSAPGYEYRDMLERYRFSFANGSYTDIVGHTEKVSQPEGSAAVADKLINKLSELYFTVLNFELPCHTDEQNIKYYTEEDIMNALCEFCTKPVAEEFFNIVSRELYIVNGRLYSYDEAPAWFPPRDYVESAEEKNGVITARLFSYYSGQDIPYNIRPPVYAEFVREDGVWKISSLPKEK